MKSSLVPEKPLLVYPSLAATVGLDEAVMLSALGDMVNYHQGDAHNGYHWHHIELESLSEALPFWDRRDLHRVCTALREKGIILVASAPLVQETYLKFAFNEKSAETQTPPRKQATPARIEHNNPVGKNFISSSWRPDQIALEQLAQLGIPAEFAMQQVPEFVTYWRERNEPHRSWGQKFINHTLKRWRTFEAQQHRQTKAQALPSHWSPSDTCVQGLMQKNIPQQFILDQIREFIAFWQATGEKHLSWDSKFTHRVHTLWAEMESKRNVSNKEYSIFSGWRPSADAMDLMVKKSEVPISFIEDAIPEFIIYWQERGTNSNTWNSMFIKHVRLQWHRFKHALDNAVEAHPITENWQPSDDVFDILKLANIDGDFAQSLVPEFILYWKDRNELHRSWNTRFLQHVKRTWAARHKFVASDNDNVRSTRDISLEEELNDTSWAN